jgi:tRNA pseudouridine38-40 synthase
MTPKWKLTIEYDGGPFAGWQRQPNVISVQECIETAIKAFTGQETVDLTVAGRTDAGVHALGQVAHVRIARPDIDAKAMRDATNFHLRPHPIAITAAERVADDFNARMSAVNRVYCYKILCHRRADNVLLRDRVWHVAHDLDIAAMNAGARHLIGMHDFSTFRDSECQAKSPVRSIERLEIIEREDALFGRHLELWAEARSFLHHQIRNITGTLKLVGDGKWSPDDVKKALEMRDRRAGGPTAPPHGLYFVRVDY